VETRSNAPYYKQFRSPIQERERFRLQAINTWSINMENGVEIDGHFQAAAFTPKGIELGPIQDFAKQRLPDGLPAFYRLEIGAINTESIDDIHNLSFELSYLIPVKYNRGGIRRRVGFRAAGLLLNLGMSQAEIIPGLIAVGEVGNLKGQAKEVGKGSSVKPFSPRIPGSIEDWMSSRRGVPQHLMVSTDPAVLRNIRGSLRITYR